MSVDSSLEDNSIWHQWSCDSCCCYRYHSQDTALVKMHLQCRVISAFLNFPEKTKIESDKSSSQLLLSNYI